MSNYVAITVPADGLAPLGARPSAGTVIINFDSHIYTGVALEGYKLIITFFQDLLHIWHIMQNKKDKFVGSRHAWKSSVRVNCQEQ